MPSTYKSPFATSFKSAIKRGTPCSVVVNNIAKRNSKNPNTVFNSLFKAGLCFRQKFNGQWIYWACEGVKSNATVSKECQFNMWQNFVDWCICSGVCTPEQMKKNCGSQIEFMNWCRKNFAKQFSNGTTVSSKKTSGRRRPSTMSRAKKRTTTTSRKRTATTSRKRTATTSRKRRTTTAAKRTGAKSSYSVVGRKTSNRKYRRAA